jgi:hypothetical protein
LDEVTVDHGTSQTNRAEDGIHLAYLAILQFEPPDRTYFLSLLSHEYLLQLVQHVFPFSQRHTDHRRHRNGHSKAEKGVWREGRLKAPQALGAGDTIATEHLMFAHQLLSSMWQRNVGGPAMADK